MQFENFSFYWSCLWYRRTLPSPRSWRFFMFFSKSSTVLCFTFKPVVHFELIFYRVWLRLKVIFFFLVYECFFTPAPFVEKVIPPPLNCFWTFDKISWAYLCGSIHAFSILFHWSIPWPIAPSLDCHYMMSWNQTDSFHIILLSQNCFSCCSSSVFHIYFRIIVSISTKNISGIFIGIGLKLCISLESIDMTPMLNL